MARLRNAIGIDADNWVNASVSGATTAVAAAMPAGPALRLVFSWVASNTDQRDREAIERIVRHVADHPGAAVDNLKALGEAAIGAAQQQVSSDDLRQLGYRMAAGQYVLFSVMAAGIVWGFLKSIYEAIEGVVDIVGDLESFIDESLQLLEAILSPQGGEACREIGMAVGGSAATKLRTIANENYLYAAFHIGEIVGPFVVGIIVAYFTAGAGTAAIASARITQVLAKIRRIPRASRILDSMLGRMRKKHQRGSPGLTLEDEVDAVFERIARGDAPPGQGALLGDLMHHRQRREALEQLRRQVNANMSGRPGRTPPGAAVNPNPGYQSAHTTAQSALRSLPQYDPGAMITRFLPTGRGHAHTLFDQAWQREFRQIRQQTGRTTTTAQELAEVTERAARNSGAFSPAEAESMVQLIHEDLFVQLGLARDQVLRMPGT